MTHETKALFEALFALEEVRELLRNSAPGHELTDEQKKKLKEYLDYIKDSVSQLEKLQ